LKTKGVDATKWSSSDDGGRIRKKMKRNAGGEITVPCPVTNTKLKKLSQKKLLREYNVWGTYCTSTSKFCSTCSMSIIQGNCGYFNYD
jgi:hypothetical protein